MRRFGGAGIVLFALAGCARRDALLPLEPGRTWTYVVRGGFESYVETMRVGDPVAVAGTDGRTLEGPLGVSRVAWKDGVLYASQTALGRFYPPLPLVGPAGKEIRYHGMWVHGKGVEGVSARLTTKDDVKLALDARDYVGTLAVLTLRLPKDGIELKTWLVTGLGVVQQEQRTNRARDVQIQLLTTREP